MLRPGAIAVGVIGAEAAVADASTSVEAVYRAEADRLWRSVFAFAGDTEIASDAVAEAYAQLLRRGDVVRDPAAWVWRTAFRIAAGTLKGRRRGDVIRLAYLDAGEPAEHDAYADPDLLRALQGLPEAQRAAVILFYYGDLPISQIAYRLGSNGLAVRANLSRGRKRLRQLLGDDHA